MGWFYWKVSIYLNLYTYKYDKLIYNLFIIYRFIASLRGHVCPVYQVCWSSDSRLLISASKDSTLKIWDLKSKKIKLDLPGHVSGKFVF